MPSSRNAAVLSGAALADAGNRTVSPWQPVSLADGAAAAATGMVALPQFEPGAKPANPSLRAFSLSRTAGIPAGLLAAETAAARAAGYAAGYTAGIDDARAATRDRLAADAAAAENASAARDAAISQAFGALFAAAEGLEGRAVQSAADIEEQIVSAAYSIAEAIVGRVLADDETRGQAALTRALALAPADEDVTVAVSPADFLVLAAGRGDGADDAAAATDLTPLRRYRGLRTVTILADEALAPGDAVAACGATTIDARLSAAVQRVKLVLGA